jgi:cytochrome P450
VTYFLLDNPHCLAKATQEVRSAFKSEDEITLISVQTLSYMLECLTETLRLYPPIPIGLPRATPEGGATIDGVVVPENVSKLHPCI